MNEERINETEEEEKVLVKKEWINGGRPKQ